MDKLSMEDLGYFLYMREMERKQQAGQGGGEADADADEEQG